MVSNARFFGTHNHTKYSNINGFNDSTVKIKDLLLKAHELGHQGVAITDHANISAHIKALQTTKALKKEGKLPENFTLGLGVEGYVLDEAQMKRDVEANQRTNFYHLVLIAKDEIGHHQIRQLTSRAYKRSFTYRGILRIPMFYTDFQEIIGVNKGHLVATSACLGSYLGKIVSDMIKQPEHERQAHKDKIYDFMCWAMDTFGENNFYLELQPSYNQEQIDYNQMLIKIAKAYQLPLSIATDVHYLRPENQQTHSAFLRSDEKNSGGRELGDFYNDTYLHSVEEMWEKLSYMELEDFKQAILNTAYIASQIQEYDLAHDQIIPKIPLPAENTWEYYPEFYEQAHQYEYIQQMIESDEIYDRYLINRIFYGIYDRNIQPTRYSAVLSRVNLEMKELIGISKAKRQPISSYFITMQKAIELMWTEAGCLLAPGRGSAAGWITNFLLRITMIDSLEQGIEMPIFRFISAERPDYPDSI